jgi:hypothetical protein
MCIALYAEYVQITGSPAAGILLSQLCYWAKKSKQEWFYKTQTEWSKETGLTRSMIESAQKLLVKLGILIIEKRGLPAKNHYRVNFKTLHRLVDDLSDEHAEILQTSTQESCNLHAETLRTSMQESCELNAGNLLTGAQEIRSLVRSNPADILHKITTKTTHKINTKITTEEPLVSQTLDQAADKKTVVEIFEHWKQAMGHSKAQLDDKRRSLIRKALKMGYSQVQLCQAIDGCAITPHNIGENDRGQRYDGLHILFRSADQIDRFMRNAEKPPRVLNKAQQSEAHNDRVVGNVLRQLATGEMAL